MSSEVFLTAVIIAAVLHLIILALSIYTSIKEKKLSKMTVALFVTAVLLIGSAIAVTRALLSIVH